MPGVRLRLVHRPAPRLQLDRAMGGAQDARHTTSARRADSGARHEAQVKDDEPLRYEKSMKPGFAQAYPRDKVEYRSESALTWTC
jgi:hypothetical protein